jgi:hypothetical protein
MTRQCNAIMNDRILLIIPALLTMMSGTVIDVDFRMGHIQASPFNQINQ